MSLLSSATELGLTAADRCGLAIKTCRCSFCIRWVPGKGSTTASLEKSGERVNLLHVLLPSIQHNLGPRSEVAIARIDLVGEVEEVSRALTPIGD